MPDKSKCEYCGGKIVRKYWGSYGDVFPVLPDGKCGKKKIRREIYEYDGDFITYCSKCGEWAVSH